MTLKKQRKGNKQRQLVKTKKSLFLHTVLVAALAISTFLASSANYADAHVSIHVVKKGDTLWSLAQKHHVTVQQIMNANGLSSHTIYIGEKLELPGKDLPPAALKMERPAPVRTDLPKPPAPETRNNNTKATYTVVSKDTLWSISQKFGMSVAELKALNGLKSNLIYIGQQLKVKTATATITATVVGAVDPHTVEFERNGTFFSLQVPYSTAESFQELIGEKISISYQEETRTLISWSK
ncbi:LysM peptidoglycan-binding domain-containing protein [Bacillus taeanensis]|nr:LysM peptidoglycan-binding domain-containing protein [Bacillus taeanensis]